MPRFPTLAVLALAAAAAACGGKADVKLRVDNQTVAGALVAGTDRSLELKLIAVYLAEDVDPQTQDNVGETQMIWLNAQCNDDIQGCLPSGMPGGGPRVTSFFDFGQPTDVVNAAINGQGRAVKTGTYRYARMEFCKYGMPGEPNLRWRGPGMTGAREMIVGDCGRTSQVFSPPLTLADGESVTVTLGYDMAQSIRSGAPGPNGSMSIAGVDHWFRDCEDLAGGTRVCMDFPDFQPTATKQ
ncbi:MAG: hypothetical protein QM704_07480 [Anaeromyxobacteraceae bacterium]